VQADVVGENLLAEGVDQERRLAVQRAAARRLHEISEQPAGEWRLEQHGALARADLARRQARERAPRGVIADRFGGREFGMDARGRVPVVALHPVWLRAIGDTEIEWREYG